MCCPSLPHGKKQLPKLLRNFLRALAQDPDLNNSEFNRAFVLMQYFGYLRRNPNDPQDSDYTGYDFWLTVKAFIVSGEYRNRFGP